MTQVYELVTKEGGVSYSLFVIWSQLFLLHKGIQFTTIPLTYTKIGPTIKEVTGGKWGKVPTIKFDNGDIQYDSIPICNYLDEKYPENPIRRSGSKAEAAIFKFKESIGSTPQKFILLDIVRNLDEESRIHVRKIKEEDKKMTLEEFVGNQDENYTKFYKCVATLTPFLENSNFLEGETAGFSDYLLAGMLQYIRTINPKIYTKLVHDSPYP
ncbi:hypothetical protein CONCODRAFT_8733 [Conidiobolus coronatus NRRL 28638]|uniref:Uncharacterized protein n=1 Tax=Conidiobolus coronatus (strain ATCC 28846 / CBS 209.66 / NRRL 28638) TaxID=796925 RepID=A0A137P1U4_CONC2|nr:hypothetical protein CONCODRAFT_8733 [Conidiobolus coronatus NRRL 28638]|eukprot:KXN68928.1 hypothetical protein CONCODRAFT_8733 [Conidiobolus coronatus NRRL 28638]